MEWVCYCFVGSDYNQIKNQIEVEQFPRGDQTDSVKYFHQLSKDEQQAKLKDRVKKYCQKVYRRVLDKPMTEVRIAGVCQRENPFYIDTVRSFRDRRYEYKGLNKLWKGKVAEATKDGDQEKLQEAKDMVVIYDSLQLAHKCILNSFYGYVMRKGARWYSMEMAGITTYTGAKLIQCARMLIEQVGKPLELDTDGIWCCLPGHFPENYSFLPRDPTKKKVTISYPCAMLNADVKKNNTNDQYQTLSDPVRKTYDISSECSIAFEVDGPYRAMILPASKEEGVLIKKRYAVFNSDGSLAELKGFEIKRRGELKLIKIFQSEVFQMFLEGSTLEECYEAVAKVANKLLDLLDSHGTDMEDSLLIEHISESSTMSKSLEEYGSRKSCATTCAKRLADFLGDAMVKDKGLACKYIVAKYPQAAPVSERAIPVAIFSAEPEVTRAYLRRWCKEGHDHNIRSILDWDYYKGRLSSTIQKIVSIPAAMQNVKNPVPRVTHPEWLGKRIREKEGRHRQKSIIDMMSRLPVQSLVQNLHTAADMEDVGVLPSVNRPAVKKFSRRRGGKKLDSRGDSLAHEGDLEVEKSHEVDSLVRNERERSVSPDREHKYSAWLEHKKRKWKLERMSKKIPRLIPNGEELNKKSKTVSSVGSIFRQREAALSRSHWQVLQISHGANSDFVAWVIAGLDLHRVTIHVDHHFFIDLKEVNDSVPGQKVNRILPHGRRQHHLYEISVPESEHDKLGRLIKMHLADPNIEGVYETKIPAITQALLDMGCVCTVDPKSRGRSSAEGWALSELRRRSTSDFPYLESEGPSLTFFYIYHCTMDQRALFVLFSPVTSTLLAIFVNPFSNRDVTAGQLERQAREAMGNSAGLLGIEDEPTVSSVQLEWVTSEGEAFKVLQRCLQDTTGQHRSPTLALLESPLPAIFSSRNIPILSNFPLVRAPHNASDNQFPLLQWQPVAVKNAIQRCATITPWLKERKEMAKYANIPLANFEPDWILHAADLTLGRALRDRQHVLWMAENGIPDLGGGLVAADSSDELHQPTICYKGAYRSITVELKISHLAVNSLLKSHVVNELEGGSLFTAPTADADAGLPAGSSVLSDDSTECGPALRVARQVVQSWVSDALSSGSVFANLLLLHVYRWLCSPSSKLHDPAMHRALHKVMQKVLARLLSEMKRLGASIVFADFSRVIIATGKRTPGAARDYCDFLVKTLKTNDLFKWLDLEPQRAWYSLLFMDQYNFGGIAANLYSGSSSPAAAGDDESCTVLGGMPAGSQRSETGSDGEDILQLEEKPDVVCSWNVAEYLPPACQSYFVMLVSEYVWIPWAYTRERMRSRMSDSAGQALSTPSILLSEQSQVDAEEAKFIKGKVKFHFTEKLLKVVKDIDRRMALGSADAESDWRFPVLAGSHLPLTSPALEFIKSTCAVFALDPAVDHQVLIMKRQLLKLIHVREFSLEAAFQNPCLSFTLPNVICSFCNDCRDLDLCRDPALNNREWKCFQPSCQQPYDREWVENALVQVVRRKCSQYQVQDLKCKKCRQVKAARLAPHCSCAGEWVCAQPAENVRQSLKVFLSVAEYHGFRALEEAVQWLLKLS